jgi:hypothetical protein
MSCFTAMDGEFAGWRCVLCGEIIDQVILENRECQKTRKTGHKKHGFTEDSRQEYSGA